MRYPFWLPYPKAYIQTIVLFVSVIPIYWVQYALFRWLNVSFTIADIWHNSRDLLATYFSLILSIAILLPIFLLSIVHQFLWGEPMPNVPAIVPAPKSLLRGVVDWTFNVVGVIMAVSLWLDLNYEYIPRSIPHSKVMAISISWVIIVAYFYHFWFFLVRRYQRIEERLKKRNK